MRTLLTLLSIIFLWNAEAKEPTMSIYEFNATKMDGTDVPLERYRGKVMLIVNTASRCGFTPQFEGLETLHRTYKDQGLAVLGFPCNQFADQDPGTNEEIENFCRVNYGVSFEMFKKIDVNGEGTHPLFVYLKAHAPGMLGSESIKWNFTKFLIDRDGHVVERFAPVTKPESLTDAIEKLLAEKPGE